MDKLTEKVAEAMWNADSDAHGVSRDRVPWIGLHHSSQAHWGFLAAAAIAAVRAHDAEQAKVAINAFMATHDPDDYTHPLSLTVGPRHERHGLTKGEA